MLLIKVVTTCPVAVEVHVAAAGETLGGGGASEDPRESRSSPDSAADPASAEAEFVFGHLRPQSD